MHRTSHGIDWKTAVLLLPSTLAYSLAKTSKIGRLPYYYFLLLGPCMRLGKGDWKTAVLLLPSTMAATVSSAPRLEDCRIITSFYSGRWLSWFYRIGRLPYYYFLLLMRWLTSLKQDWKTAVLLLPSTDHSSWGVVLGLEDCRIITSFYFPFDAVPLDEIGRLPYYYFLLLVVIRFAFIADWKTAVLLLPSTTWSKHRVTVGLEDCRIITSFY